MSFLDNKHKRKSFALTALLLSALLLLLFYIGLTYLDPPEEKGITVNLGNMEIGMGEIQPAASLTPSVAEPIVETETIEETQIPEATPQQPEIKESQAPETKAEPLLTREEEESIRIRQREEARKKSEAEAAKRQKDAEAAKLKKEQEEARRIERERQEALEAKRRAEEAKRKQLDDLMGGLNNAKGNTKGGEGDDRSGGDKGQANGNPYATTYNGTAGTDSGNNYSLSGRKLMDFEKSPHNCNETGTVVVTIKVNRKGEVIYAEPGAKGTTNKTPCLLEAAKKRALTYVWNEDNTKPEWQIGEITFNFKLGQ
jgi:outer membrane biosynthesis protein TonB